MRPPNRKLLQRQLDTRLRSSLLAAVAVCLCVVSSGAISSLVLRNQHEASAALRLATTRTTITELILQQERFERGEIDAVADNQALRRQVERDFNAAFADLDALDPSLAAGIRTSLDAFLDGRDIWLEAMNLNAANPEVEPARAKGEVRDSPEAELIDQRIIDPAAEALDSALSVAVMEAQRRSERTSRQSIMAIWALSLAGGSCAVVITRRGLRTAKRAALHERDRMADERLRALVAHNDEVLLVFRADSGRMLYASPSVERVLGYSTADLLGQIDPFFFVDPDDIEQWVGHLHQVSDQRGAHRRVEVRARRRDGQRIHLETDITNLIHEPSIGGVVVNARDISDRVSLQQDLAHQATHDVLTGLANRLWFAEQVEAALRGVDHPSAVSVVLVDLDGFKEINDSLGHGAGDEVLITVAARLSTLTRQRDCVARLGGDEFALLLIGDHAHPLAERIVEQLKVPVALDVGPVTIGGSVGVATAAPGSTVVSLLRDADAAMYDAKARGKNRVSVFTPEMHAALMERLQLRADLDAGLLNEEFRLVYQPKLNLGSGELEGFEALIRWHKADGRVVAPVEFIPAAEATGQIVPIGMWVLHTALRQLARWQQISPLGQRLSMAVNVSTRQLGSPNFVSQVYEALVLSKVPARSVTLELTETMLVADLAEAARILSQLRQLGVRIAVDDYGAGHASIGYLRMLPIDVLKIDRSFIAALDKEPVEADAYLRSITDLARSLRLDTVAEGIEHESQLAHLRDLGCNSGQGYHLARPLDPEAATQFVVQRRHTDA